MASLTFILNRRGWQVTEWMKAKDISSVAELSAAIRQLGAEEIDGKLARSLVKEINQRQDLSIKLETQVDLPKKKLKKKKEVLIIDNDVTEPV